MRFKTYLSEPAERRVDDALAEVQSERPGKRVRLPGPVQASRAERWDAAVVLLELFVDREGHARVPYEHTEGTFPLGKWVGSRRMQHRRGRLTPERVTQLEALPGWTWDAVASAWETGFAHLLSFFEEHGSVNVPADHKTADGYPLGSWVRSHRRPRGRRTMTDEQQTRLSAVPGWTWRPVGATTEAPPGDEFLFQFDAS